jgi:hypothetical protein
VREVVVEGWAGEKLPAYRLNDAAGEKRKNDTLQIQTDRE